MVQNLKRSRAPYIHISVFILASVAQIGCGRVGGYPEATINSPIGREGVCVACSKKIGSVSNNNLVTVDGNQFIVCDETCAKKVEAVTEHSHSH